MQSVSRITMAAALLGGSLLVLPGCQTSGRRDDTVRAVPASAAFDRAYVATRDTDYKNNATSTGADGRVASGTRVWFDTAPSATDAWQRARVEGQGVVWVRPADYARAQ